MVYTVVAVSTSSNLVDRDLRGRGILVKIRKGKEYEMHRAGLHGEAGVCCLKDLWKRHVERRTRPHHRRPHESDSITNLNYKRIRFNRYTLLGQSHKGQGALRKAGDTDLQID